MAVKKEKKDKYWIVFFELSWVMYLDGDTKKPYLRYSKDTTVVKGDFPNYRECREHTMKGLREAIEENIKTVKDEDCKEILRGINFGITDFKEITKEQFEEWRR
jgi:hypothetical protein